MYTSTKRNKVLVHGCSFTDSNFQSTDHKDLVTDWLAWPDILAERHNWELNNLAIMGNSNNSMFQDAISELLLSDYDYCIIALTEWWRYDTAFGPIDYNLWFMDENARVTEQIRHSPERWDNIQDQFKIMELLKPSPRNEKLIVDETLRWMHELVYMCMQKNVKLIMFQMLNAIGNSMAPIKPLLDHVISNPHFARLDNLRKEPNISLVGWPYHTELGGSRMTARLEGDWQVSKIDTHPNGNGHMQIANAIEEEL